jgi:hypothetical protein
VIERCQILGELLHARRTDEGRSDATVAQYQTSAICASV